jgi:hypothetical protein
MLMLLSTFVRDTSPHGLGTRKRLSSLRYEEGAAMFDAYQVVGDGSTAGFPAKGGVEL